jgi:hypothetical protein
MSSLKDSKVRLHGWTIQPQSKQHLATDFPRLTAVDRTDLDREGVLEVFPEDLLQFCYVEKHLAHESVLRCVLVPQRELKLFLIQDEGRGDQCQIANK